LAAASLVTLRAAGAGEQPILEYSYRGSREAGREFVAVMKDPVVQSLLLEVASSPRSRPFVDAALEKSQVTAGQLESLGLIRPNADLYELAFPLLTREDRQTIQAVAEREGARLAERLLAHRSRVEELLTSDPIPGVDWHATAYFVLGCVSLDWDGLNLVESRGYLAAPAEGKYLPTAYQSLPRETLRQIYWGSHSYHDALAVTTFGDHYSLPRSGLPDALWSLSASVPEPVQSKLTNAAAGLARRHAAALMLALRDGPKTTTQLAAATGFGQDDVQDVLALLLALEYVSESEGVYGPMIPVLTERDRPMVSELRLLGRQVMLDWLAERYESLSDELATLTPRRYSIPLSSCFYWVWHPIFGVANRELVAAGLFADPYDKGRTFKGFIPSVYQLDVVQGEIAGAESPDDAPRPAGE
jgi:hypothetical protein